MDNKTANKKTICTLFLIYIFLLVWILFFKGGIKWFFNFDKTHLLTRKEWFAIGINPLKSFWRYSLKGTLPRYYFEQLLNVAALVPFGVLAPFLMKKPFVFLSSFCMILAIELSQGFLLIGGFDTVDIMTNMLGTTIGVAIHKKYVTKMHANTVNKTCKTITFSTLPLVAFAIFTFVFWVPDIMAQAAQL